MCNCAQLHSLAETLQPSPLHPHLSSCKRVLLVSHDRRHLFVTPWCPSTLFLIPGTSICSTRAPICRPFKEPRNRFPAWRLSYRPARHHRMAESIHRNRFIGIDFIDSEDSIPGSTLIKKKIKFSSYIRKFRVEQLQSHIWGRASYNIWGNAQIFPHKWGGR
jgi:hypothetical protein